MAEKQNGAEMLSALMGEQGADALQMLRRMERLKRLMGTPRLPEQAEQASTPKEEESIFARSRGENMISAAIPFLDQEYQKDIYVVVRLMEMRRVLGEEWVQSREKQSLSAKTRRRQMLSAMRPYLPHTEQGQLDTAMKLMDLREIMEQERGQ